MDGSSDALPERPAPSMLARHRDVLLRRIRGEDTRDEPTMVSAKLRLVRRLGKGGMGAVWEAEHVGLRMRVALKRLQPELADDPRLRRRLLREARSVATVKHPNVIEILDVCEDDEGSPYLVMELVDGDPLSEVVRRDGAMPWSRASQLLAQLASALACAHRHGVVHRDLKPGNVIVCGAGTPQESVKVIDFGLAKHRTGDDDSRDLTRSGEVFGSPGYMSPEQLRGMPVDAGTDVYALGCIAFELLTGHKPFPGPTVADLVAQHLTSPPPAPKAILASARQLPAIRALVLHALRKDAAERPRDAAAFADELLRIPSAGGSSTKRRATIRVLALAAVVGSVALASNWASIPAAAPERVDTATRAPTAFTEELERPIDRATPQWPGGWVGAELGIAEPRRDHEAPQLTDIHAAEDVAAMWGADPRDLLPYRMVIDRDDAYALSQAAVARGLTLGHAVDDPPLAELEGHAGEPASERTFWPDAHAFPRRAIGTVQLGPGCAGVQVGPVHVLTSAACMWNRGGQPREDRRWHPAHTREDADSTIAFVRVYVPQQWAQHDRAGFFNWAIAITEERIGDEYFGVTALPDEALRDSALYHRGYPLERDTSCDARSPTDWASGGNRLWGNPEPLEGALALRAPSFVSGWDHMLATTAVTSVGHIGGPYYFYDASNRPVVVAIHRSGCTDRDGGTAEFCGFTPPWQCGAPTRLPSQAIRLEPDALYGHIVPALTWWGVADDGRAVCLLANGC